MGGLHFAIEADRQLTMLQADPARGQLYDRINDVLDAIEDDPGSRRVRYIDWCVSCGKGGGSFWKEGYDAFWKRLHGSVHLTPG